MFDDSKTQEVLDFCEMYRLNKSKISQETKDGSTFLIFNSHMNFERMDFKEIPKALIYFKEIKGSLSFNYCGNLKNLENLRNLRRVGGNLSFYYCLGLKSLNGLGNLEYVGYSFNFEYCDKLKSFDGLNPNVDVGKNGDYTIMPYYKHQPFVEWKIKNRKETPVKKDTKEYLLKEIYSFKQSKNLDLSDSEIKEIVDSLYI